MVGEFLKFSAKNLVIIGGFYVKWQEVVMKSMLFHRDFLRFTGGHLKLWEYFGHVRHSAEYVPDIYFSETTRWENNELWMSEKPFALNSWDCKEADAIFMEGTDWLDVKWQEFSASKPVINLIQHVRHANPDNIRYTFLQNKAIRICVSPEVSECLSATQRVNGPVFTIPLGLDLSLLPQPLSGDQRDIPVLLDGMKNQPLAREVSAELEKLGIRHELHIKYQPRSVFLEKLNRSKIAVFLPMAEGEGFFMPALEAMSLGILVVCPDSVGNRSFCLDGVTCLMPSYSVEQIVQATIQATTMTEMEVNCIKSEGLKMVEKHGILEERRAFLDILDNLEQIW